MLTKALLFTVIPAVCCILASTGAAVWSFAGWLRSYIQHFAAGLVFAAAAAEILPDVIHRRAPMAAICGFALGVLLMLILRGISRTAGEEGNGQSNAFALSLIVGFDIFLDGLLLGFSFAAGQRAGMLLTFALTAEFVSLGIAATSQLRSTGTPLIKAVLISWVLAVIPFPAVVAGTLLMSSLPAYMIEAFLALALAALLYLVTEELLVEAHKERETPLATAMFFLGFLVILSLDMLGA